MHKIRYCILKFITEKTFVLSEIGCLRGYISEKYKDNNLYHNHMIDENENFKNISGCILRFPKIQYKLINGHFAIIGIGEGADFIKKNFMEIGSIKIKTRVEEGKGEQIEKEYEILSKEFTITEAEFYVDKDNLYTYEFKTPILPFNTTNVKLFEEGNIDLSKLITNHILSAFKGCDIKLNKEELIKSSFIVAKKGEISYRNNKLHSFTGILTTNVKIPEYFGLGRHKASGLGMVQTYKQSF